MLNDKLQNAKWLRFNNNNFDWTSCGTFKYNYSKRQRV